MGSPRTCGCRGGVIVPLRPDVTVESNQRRAGLARRAAESAEEVSDLPQQLSLFDKLPER